MKKKQPEVLLPSSVTNILKQDSIVIDGKNLSSSDYKQVNRYAGINIAPFLLKQEEINQLCEALNRGDYQASIFEKRDFTLYALAALFQSKISMEQFSTVSFYWIALEDAQEALKVVNKVEKYYNQRNLNIKFAKIVMDIFNNPESKMIKKY